MALRRILAAAAAAAVVALAFASPAAAARLNLSATALASAGDPILGNLGGLTFAATSIEFSASANVGAATPAGPGLDVQFDQTSVTIVGSFLGSSDTSRTVELITPMDATFDGVSQFMLGYFTDPVPLMTAVTPTPVLWDAATGFAPTPATFQVIDWTTVNPAHLATDAGQLTLFFGPGVDAIAPGVLAASVSDVPLPAAAPMLLGALGLIGFARARRRA